MNFSPLCSITEMFLVCVECSELMWSDGYALILSCLRQISARWQCYCRPLGACSFFNSSRLHEVGNWEALFNNEINSSWGTLELSRFGGSILRRKNPSLLHPLLFIQLGFFILYFYYIYEKQTMRDRIWLLLFREASWGIFRMACYCFKTVKCREHTVHMEYLLFPQLELRYSC